MDLTYFTSALRDVIECRSVDWLYEPGDLLIVQGMPPYCLIVILQGDVDVGLRQKDGRIVFLATARQVPSSEKWRFLWVSPVPPKLAR